MQQRQQDMELKAVQFTAHRKTFNMVMIYQPGRLSLAPQWQKNIVKYL